jgi:ABC-type transport system substrate-binding protein
MSSLGVALLVAATTGGVAVSATRTAGATKGLRGGTLRIVQSGAAFDTLDPGLAYVTNDWDVLYSTQLLLVNFPDRGGKAGGQLHPEAAKSFPTVSDHGKTVTFHLRSGLRFSDGSPVTAASYRRAWERVLSPKMYAQYGIFDQLNTMIVGAQEFTDGKAAHIRGIRANGLTLTFHLTKPNPTFLSILSMQWFGAVKPNMPYTKKPNGIVKYPSAGPYYIATNRPGRVLALRRNPYYHGARPSNPDEIVINSYPSSNGEASLLQIERNQVDFDLSGVPAADVGTVAAKYGGPNHGQFHVGTQFCVIWLALDNRKRPTNDVRIRRALNYAIGRTPIIKLLGPYAARATDQVLVPGMAGYRKFSVYGDYPNFAKARQAGGSALDHAAPLDLPYAAASPSRTSEAEFIQAQLQRIGLTVNLIPQEDLGPSPIETRPRYNIVHSGYCADYFDPFDLINQTFARTRKTAVTDAYLNFSNASFAGRAAHAASLSGRARARAYAALDRSLMTKYAPVVPLYNPTFRYLVSKRVRNVVYSNYLGAPILNAMSVR